MAAIVTGMSTTTAYYILQLIYSKCEVSAVLKGFTSLCEGGKSINSHLAQRVA